MTAGAGRWSDEDGLPGSAESTSAAALVAGRQRHASQLAANILSTETEKNGQEDDGALYRPAPHASTNRASRTGYTESRPQCGHAVGGGWYSPAW
jgi:hypothetical protein